MSPSRFDSSWRREPSTVPAGRYALQVDRVDWDTTRSGADRWSLRLTVWTPTTQLGFGAFACWDALAFTARGRIYARRVLTAFGLPRDGLLRVEPDELRGRVAIATVRPVTYTNASGETVVRNEVDPESWAQLTAAVRQ